MSATLLRVRRVGLSFWSVGFRALGEEGYMGSIL